VISKEDRIAAFKNYVVEVIDGKTYAVVECAFGRKAGEVHVQKVYQRLGDAKDPPKKTWWGTTLAADHRFAETQTRLEELRTFRKERP
jgi:hypothetical protein